MARIKEYDDNEYVYAVGGDSLNRSIDTKAALSAAWNEGEYYRLLSFSDPVGDNFYDERSTTARIIQDNFHDKITDPDGVYRNRVTGLDEKRSQEILSIPELDATYGLDGRIKFDREMTITEAQLIHERKLEEMQMQTIYEAASGWQKTGMFFSTLGSAFVDPVNVGLLFMPEPFVSKAGFLSNVARAGLSTARFYRGAKTMAIYSTGFEVPVLYQKQREYADYGLTQSLLNIAFSTAVGGGLHVGGGKIKDTVKGLDRETFNATVSLAHSQAQADKAINVDLLFRAVYDSSTKPKADGRLLVDLPGANPTKVGNYEPIYNMYKAGADKHKKNLLKQQLAKKRDEAKDDVLLNEDHISPETSVKAKKKTLVELEENKVDLDQLVPDEMYNLAVNFVIKRKDTKQIITQLQKELKIGYNKASAMVTQMEADGIISKIDTQTGKRQILNKKPFKDIDKTVEGIMIKIEANNSKFTPEEINVIQRWDDFNFNMQRVLGESYKPGKGKQPIAEIREQIQVLRDAIAKSDGLDENIVIYSGKNAGHFQVEGMPTGPIVNNRKSAKGLVGKVIQTEGFLNGSLNKNTALRFTERTPSASSSKKEKIPAIIKIFVPRGTKLVMGNKKEMEVILDVGTSLRIRKAVWKGKSENRRLEIDAEVYATRSGDDSITLDSAINQSKEYKNDPKNQFMDDTMNPSPKEEALNGREKIQKIDDDSLKVQLREEEAAYKAMKKEFEEELRAMAEDGSMTPDDIAMLRELEESQLRSEAKAKAKAAGKKAITQCVLNGED